MRIINGSLAGNKDGIVNVLNMVGVTVMGGGNMLGSSNIGGGKASGDICSVHVRVVGGVLSTERTFVGTYEGEGELPDEPIGL